MLGRLAQPGAPGAPAPQLKPAEVERFKAMARQTMADAGMPPDQIEAHLDEYVANAQQWMAEEWDLTMCRPSRRCAATGIRRRVR